MSENEKDWGSPAFLQIYSALAATDISSDGRVSEWLNSNGFSNLTVCPHCRVDDFTHVEGCLLGKGIDTMARMIAGDLERELKQAFKPGSSS